MCPTLKKLYELLGIKDVCINIYHPQIDRLVEQLNNISKSMIQKFIYEIEHNWDCWLDPRLFAFG